MKPGDIIILYGTPATVLHVQPVIDVSLLTEWPDCAIPGCPNAACLKLDSPYCFPHHHRN